MNDEKSVWCWTDGSPGRSASWAGAAAYVIADAITHEVLQEGVEAFPHPDPVNGRLTNNDMEMTAIYLCMHQARFLGAEKIKIHSDSEWAVNIVNGTYKISMKKFESMVWEIWRIGHQFSVAEIKHIPREMNKRADWHCTKATGQSRAVARVPSISW